MAIGLALGIAATLLAAAAREVGPSALESDPEGWTDLLAHAGPNLDGWRRVPIPPTASLSSQTPWILDPDSKHLICQGERGKHEWLRWNREMDDMILHVEWRFILSADRKDYDSGIFARNSEDGSSWIEAQVGDGSGGYLFGNLMPSGKSTEFDLSNQLRDRRVRPAGQWNTYEITCRGHEVSVWVNGSVTSVWPDCPVPAGFVGLEADGSRIEFRNVMLKPL